MSTHDNMSPICKSIAKRKTNPRSLRPVAPLCLINLVVSVASIDSISLRLEEVPLKDQDSEAKISCPCASVQCCSTVVRTAIGWRCRHKFPPSIRGSAVPKTQTKAGRRL